MTSPALPAPRRHTFVRRALLSALAALTTALPLSATAQSPWPNKPVKLIVPFAPGGPTDTVARLIAERLQAQWQQPVVLDYKPGAGTLVGTDAVAKSAPDGHMLGMAITAHMINPSLQPRLPYDTLRDLTGIAQIAQAHFGLFAHPSLPANNIAELIAHAKKNPGALSYATPGIGTGTHLAGEMLKHLAGIDIGHVPYKGSAPAGIPKELAQRISADVARALKSPELVQRMAALGLEPVGSTPDEYNAVIRAEIDKWRGVVKAARITLE